VSDAVLVNGMRLVAMPVPGRLAMTIAVLFQVVRSEVGVAHLLEHWVLNGTENDTTGASSIEPSSI
jgi:predicted Zn-dependent peptidase